jgi:hypothetical protein
VDGATTFAAPLRPGGILIYDPFHAKEARMAIGSDDYLGTVQPARAELRKLAARGSITYYKELGQKVGRHERWPKWKDVLDAIAQDRPDISILVLNARSGWPGQIGGKPVVEGKPTEEQKRYAQAELARVFEKYAGGKPVPTLPLRKARN